MNGCHGLATRNILVIGYGNTLRGDDGVGQQVALAIAKWNVPSLAVEAVHQLTSDLAEPLSKADLAIFVDAKLAGEPDLVEVRSLEASTMPGSFGHSSDPKSLLALASTVFGRHPPAWLVSVPAVDFSVCEGLSATAMRGAADALVQVAALIGVGPVSSALAGPMRRDFPKTRRHTADDFMV